MPAGRKEKYKQINDTPDNSVTLIRKDSKADTDYKNEQKAFTEAADFLGPDTQFRKKIVDRSSADEVVNKIKQKRSPYTSQVTPGEFKSKDKIDGKMP
jgi:uncharacterized protein YlzI (FlbEa/FlbD family)